MSDTVKSQSMDQLSFNSNIASDSYVQQISLLKQKLDDEHTNYKRKLQAYQDGQQRQAQLIQKLQSKVSFVNSVCLKVIIYL